MLFNNKIFTFSSHNLYPILLLLFISLSTQAASHYPHHELRVSLDPGRSYLQIENAIRLTENRKHYLFALNKNFDLTVQGAKLSIETDLPGSQIRIYKLSGLGQNRKVQFKYQGYIDNGGSPDLAGMPKAIFNQDSLYLDGSSAWYPRFIDFPLFTFNLEVNRPENWEIISQGKRAISTSGMSYRVSVPQDNLYLLGGAFKRQAKKLALNGREIEVEVYLLGENKELAGNYLSYSVRYLKDYSQLIGDYPYDKFAIVENRYQTGYGMPSFTLLGSRVIRLPFILYTSLPHEILHNWWGNGVFVDYDKGNWSEGLSAYMADHYLSEQRGEGIAYRRKALEKYANFATENRDFALSKFTSRHNQASQAVGYSKSLMLFHMLRQQLGDELFYQNVSNFWNQYKFKKTSFSQLIQALTQGSDIDWQKFSKLWIEHAGAPRLSLDQARLVSSDSGYLLYLDISQNQGGEAYPIQLPIHLRFNGVDDQVHLINMNSRQEKVKLSLEKNPNTVILDPEYHVFRHLIQQERPASLARLFGAKKQILIYPSQGGDTAIDAWRSLARSWQKRYDNVKLISDNAVTSLPADTAVWLLGWNNNLLAENAHRLNFNFQGLVSDKQVMFQQKPFKRHQHGVVLLDADTSRQPLGFIGADNPYMISALARKLPHYNSYGALAFREETFNNVFKQSLPVINSPLEKPLTVSRP